MIPVTKKDQIVNEQSGVQASFDAHIKGENLHIILDYLRNKCYSDRVRAVLREYATNAVDVHIRHGIARPIRITLPNVLDSFLRIRDFGPALDNARIGDIFLSYGESDKRNTNSETGSLGLGCKCGFAYGDSFLVNSYRNGRMSMWNAYIDPSKRGKIDLLAESDTVEPDGLEIIIPVKDTDIAEFRSKAVEVYAYFDTAPEILEFTESEKTSYDTIRNGEVAFSGNGWKYIGKNTQSKAVMANVAYNLTLNAFTSSDMSPPLRQLLQSGMVVNFPNGSLEFAVSREELQYTEQTKKSIVKRVTEIADEITSQAEAKFNNVKTLWDAKLLWKDIFRFDGSLYSVKDLFVRKVKFNGFPLNDSSFTWSDVAGVEVGCYAKGRNKIERLTAHAIEAHTSNLVIVNDTGITNGIQNRVIKPLYDNTYTNIYVVKFASPTVEDEWRKVSGFDIPMSSLKDLPKLKLSDYYKIDSIGGGVYFNPKHASREFSYIESPQKNQTNYRRFHLKNSDYWAAEVVDLTKDSGIYLSISGFEYENQNKWMTSPDRLIEVLSQLRNLGVVVPKIYGFKASSVKKAETNPNMINFWVWLGTAIEDYLNTNPKVKQDYANREYVRNTLNSMQSYLPEIAKNVLSWNNVDQNSPLVAFSKKIAEVSSYQETQMNALNSLLSYCKITQTQKPLHNVSLDYSGMSERYPLFFDTLQSIGVSQLTTNKGRKAYSDYVVMIDTLTP